MAYYFAPGVQLNAPPAVAGDLIVGRADGMFNRLAIGANGSILNVSAGAIRWGNTIDTGGLTITAGALVVGAAVRVSTPQLHVVVPQSVETNSSGAAWVGLADPSTSAGIALGSGATYDWIQAYGALPLRINGLGGDVQIGRSLVFVTDNANDVGALGATRPRSGYFGTALIIGAAVRVSVPQLHVVVPQTVETNSSGAAWVGLADPSISAGIAMGSSAAYNWIQSYGALPLRLDGAGGDVQIGRNLVFVTDNANDVGASGATRPRDGHFGRSLRWGGDIGAGLAANITVTNVTGIGTDVQTALTAPGIGVGGGPTGVAVTDWMKVYDGTTVRWVPMFT